MADERIGIDVDTTDMSFVLKMTEEVEFIERILKKHNLFKQLSKQQLNVAISAFSMDEFDAGDQIPLNKSFYILLEGQCSISSGEETIRLLNPEDTMGDEEMLNPNTAVAHTVSAKTHVNCWKLDFDKYHRIVGNVENKVLGTPSDINSTQPNEMIQSANQPIVELKMTEEVEFIKRVLQKHNLFEQLSEQQLNIAISAFTMDEFDAGDQIPLNKSLYILLEGQCSISSDEQTIRLLNPEDTVGDEEMLNPNTTVAHTVLAKTHVNCWKLDYQSIAILLDLDPRTPATTREI